MPTITVESELYSRIEKAASERKANIEEILGQAIRRYLRELDRLDEVKQTLEKAAASGSQQTFHSAISSIEWTTPDQIIFAIDLTLELGDTTLATELSTIGRQQFPNDPALQRAAWALAPPTATIGDQPPVEGLTASIAWFEQHATKYRGHWVAVKRGKLIGTASSRRDLAPILDTYNSLTDVLIAQVP